MVVVLVVVVMMVVVSVVVDQFQPIYGQGLHLGGITFDNCYRIGVWYVMFHNNGAD